MNQLKKKENVCLWFSQKKAMEGQFFFVPLEGGKRVAKCTGITMDKKPPGDDSEYLFTTYSPIN